jgi:hypothetical protein
MSNEQVAPETRGVAVEVLTTVDLSREIEGMERRQLRMLEISVDIVTQE